MSEEGGAEKVPIWIISFADMITLLLAFFVMLQTMSKHKDNTLMKATERSFVMALAHMGLPDFLFAADGVADPNYPRLADPLDPSQDKPDPSPSLPVPQDDPGAALFEEIMRTMQVEESQTRRAVLASYPLPTRTLAGVQGVSDADRKIIEDAARELVSNLPPGRYEVFVFANAARQAEPADGWIASATCAARAEAIVAQVVQRSGRANEIRVLSWGGQPAEAAAQGGADAPEATLLVLKSQGM